MTIQLSDLMMPTMNKVYSALAVKHRQTEFHRRLDFRCFGCKVGEFHSQGQILFAGFDEDHAEAFDLLAFRSGRSREMWL